MTEKKSEAQKEAEKAAEHRQKIEKELADRYEKEGEEVTKAVDKERKNVEKYYEDRRAEEEAREQAIRGQSGIQSIDDRGAGAANAVNQQEAAPPVRQPGGKSPEQAAVDQANAEPNEPAPSGTPAAAQQEKQQNNVGEKSASEDKK